MSQSQSDFQAVLAQSAAQARRGDPFYWGPEPGSGHIVFTCAPGLCIAIPKNLERLVPWLLTAIEERDLDTMAILLKLGAPVTQAIALAEELGYDLERALLRRPELIDAVLRIEATPPWAPPPDLWTNFDSLSSKMIMINIGIDRCCIASLLVPAVNSEHVHDVARRLLELWALSADAVPSDWLTDVSEAVSKGLALCESKYDAMRFTDLLRDPRVSAALRTHIASRPAITLFDMLQPFIDRALNSILEALEASCAMARRHVSTANAKWQRAQEVVAALAKPGSLTLGVTGELARPWLLDYIRRKLWPKFPLFVTVTATDGQLGDIFADLSPLVCGYRMCAKKLHFIRQQERKTCGGIQFCSWRCHLRGCSHGACPANLCSNSVCTRTDAGFLCSKCRLARYCSHACQKAHWKQHKPECH